MTLTNPVPVTIKLPANKRVQVVITSQSCNFLQKTVITWPDGDVSMFVTDSAAAPDEHDADYDPQNPTIVTYGMMTYETGSAPSPAIVEVSEWLPDDGNWGPTLTLLDEVADSTRVKSEGHTNPARRDWNDSVVTFTW